MQKAVLIFILCSAIFSTLHAQNECTIRGMVKDSMGTALSKATVRLILTKDTLNTLTKEDGSFSFHLAAAGSFELSVTMKGYSSFRKDFPATEPSHLLILPPIVLQATYGELAPVTVLHIKPYIIKEDTVEYHTRAYAIRPGAELEALLKKLPGMLVDPDGTVTVQGKKISRVQVNGKDYPGEPLTVIRNFPADIIDIVQVIDDYGDKARLTGVKSGESEKVLNVILKKENKNGELGKLELGAGNKDRYNAVLSTDIIHDELQLTLEGWLRNQSPSGELYERGTYLGLNHDYNKKWSDNVSLGVSGDNYSSETGLVQDNFFPGNQTHLEQTNRTAGDNRANSVSYMIQFKPDEKSIFRVRSFLGGYRNQQSVTNAYASLARDSGFSKSTTGNALNLIRGHRMLSGSNLYFEKIQSPGGNRMSLELSYQVQKGQQEGDNLSHTLIQTDGLQNLSQQHYLTHTDNTERKLGGKLNYYISLGSGTLLELGYEGQYSNTQNNQDTRTGDSVHASPVSIDSLSNDYRFRTLTHRLYAGYLLHSGKTNLSLSLSAQPALQHGETFGKNTARDYRYFNFLPLAQFSYSFLPGRKLNIEYTGSSVPPSLQQLQPFTNITNPQYPVRGNPNLKPSYSHALKIHYEQFNLHSKWLQGFGLELNFSSTEGLVIPNLVHPHDTTAVVQRTIWVNANGSNSAGMNYRLDFPAVFNKRLRISTGGSISATQLPSVNDNVLYKAGNWGWGQQLSFRLDLSETLESELSGNYMNTYNSYAAGARAYSAPSASWAFSTQHYLFKKWVLNYTLSQLYSSLSAGRLFTNPALLHASLGREFLPNNQVRISFSAYDLFNSSTGIQQSVTPTSITQTRTTLLGRYFQFSIQFKAQKFHK